MIAALRAELFKQRSTPTNAALLAAMLGLVLLAVLLHGIALPAEHIRTDVDQLTVVYGWGARLAAVFAGLLGAMAITAELRHGTIRPTLLATPDRLRVLVAKCLVSALFGAGLGLLATAVAIGAGALVLGARGIDAAVGGGELAIFVGGGAAAAALWATIGVGVGAVVRNQVPALVGICAWLLFVEGVLAGDLVTALDVARFAPGALAAALSGLDPGELVAPAVGFALLAHYAVAAAAIGAVAMRRRDIA